MQSKKLGYFAAAGAAAILALLLMLTYLKKENFNNALMAQFNVCSVKNEAASAAVRLRLAELRDKAGDFNDIRERVSQMTRNRIRDNNEALLALVNPWNEIDESYMPELQTVEDGFQVDRRCGAALARMLFDCRQQGHYPVICSAFRTKEYQQDLFDKKINRLLAEGVSEEDAPALAARSVAVPGTSEHQLGLAVDLIDYFYTNLDQGQESTATQKWLMEHCSEYGFILRYPNGTTDITGIIYEPWHYRYVGKTAAREITRRGITLEEYLSEN